MSISDRGRATVWTLLTLVVLAGAAVVATFAWRDRREPPPPPVIPLRLAYAAPAEVTLGAGSDYPFGLAAAPDGRRIVFPAIRAGQHQLWLTELATGVSEPLPATEGGVLPFWSPDGLDVAFFANGRLKAFRFDGGTVRDLADAPSPRGGAWHPAGDILFAPANEGAIARRRADGRIEPWSAIDEARSERSHRHPVLLDNGTHVIYFVGASDSGRGGLWMAPFDQPAARTRLVGSEGHAIALGRWVVYPTDGALVAQAVDLDARTLRDRPRLIGAPVGTGPINQTFAAAGGDVLLFGAPSPTMRELRWVDRSGAIVATVGEPMDAWDVRAAPAGDRVAVTRLDPQLGTLDIWTYQGDRPLPRRISPAIDVDESPVWSPTASLLAWVSGRRSVMTRGAATELPEQPVHKFARPARVSDWSPDGRWIVGSTSRPGSREDIWVLPAAGGDPRLYAQSTFNEIQGAISRDGRWLAYASDESGRFEVYVDSFPTPGRRGRVTMGGGSDPRWSRNGVDVFFRRGDEVHLATVDLGGERPEAVSSTRLFAAGRDLRAYDVSPDGQRFLLNLAQEHSAPAPIRVLVHWRSLLPGS